MAPGKFMLRRNLLFRYRGGELVQEVGDSTDYSARYVAKVFETCRVSFGPRRVYKRSRVSDFVWCLENRVNSSVHNALFPGTPAPRSVSERATEPSDWDPDDIR